MTAFGARARPVGRHGIFLMLLILLLVGAATAPEFRTAENIANVLKQSAALGVLAIGQNFVIVGGMIDLSVGQLAGLVRRAQRRPHARPPGADSARASCSRWPLAPGWARSTAGSTTVCASIR